MRPVITEADCSVTGESDSGSETAVRHVIIEADCSVTGESDGGSETAV